MMNRRKKLSVIVCTVMLIVCVAVSFNLFKKEKVSDKVGSYPSYANNSKEENATDIPVDFEELRSINDEAYAWISIPETDISYPIVQSRENAEYYLENNVNREKSRYGAIFTQFYNSTDFNDFNTLIYGHAMSDGKMFGTLKNFKNKDFFEKNRYIYIYLPDGVLKYKTFAAYTFDDRNIILTYNYSGIADRQMYLDTVFSISDKDAIFADDLEIDTNDRIITLSTCTNNMKKRFLVQAVLISSGDFSREE